MEKTITIKISLDDKSEMETKEDKRDITDEVFNSMVEAIETTIKDEVDLDNDSFCNNILGNYGQTLPDNFTNLKDMGLKIEVN